MNNTVHFCTLNSVCCPKAFAHQTELEINKYTTLYVSNLFPSLFLDSICLFFSWNKPFPWLKMLSMNNTNIFVALIVLSLFDLSLIFIMVCDSFFKTYVSFNIYVVMLPTCWLGRRLGTNCTFCLTLTGFVINSACDQTTAQTLAMFCDKDCLYGNPMHSGFCLLLFTFNS